MKLQSVHLIVSGRVQGVGFRYFAEEIASRFHITGYVKNLGNGDVEIFAEGEENNLKNFYQGIKKGPALSRVINIEEDWNNLDTKQYHSFHITF